MVRFAEHANLVAFLVGASGLAVYLGGFLRDTPADPLEAVSRSVSRVALALAAAGGICLPAALLVADAPSGHFARVAGFTAGLSIAAVGARWGAWTERRTVAAHGRGTSGMEALGRIALFFPLVAVAAYFAGRGEPRAPCGVAAIGGACALAAFASRRGGPRSAAIRITCFAGASASLVLLAYAGLRWKAASGAVAGACGAAAVLSGAAWAAAWRFERRGAAVAEGFAIAGLGAALLSALAMAHVAGRV